jgi:DNA-binding LacI/PurR family transcriptional regulator
MSATRIEEAGTGKHAKLLSQYRDKICEGIWPPGKPLPSIRQLAESAGVGRMTVQRVLRELQDQGFTVASPARNVVVSDFPPHRYHYAVVFPEDPWGREQGYWPETFRVINNLLPQVNQADPRRTLVPFYDITGHADVEDYCRLKAEIASRRFAGLFYVIPRHTLRDSDLVAETNLPAVSLLGGRDFVKAVTDFRSNGSATYARALDWLVALNCRRIALLDAVTLTEAVEAEIAALFNARGLECRPHWIQQVNIGTPHTVTRLVQLLLSAPAKERPDGILVANPTLLEHVTLAVKASGLAVPDDLRIVGSVIFPGNVRCHVPVYRLGTDMRVLLRDVIETIDRYRQGGTVPPTKEIPVVLERELPARNPLLRLAEAEIVQTARV